jgi:DnaK suppressor protein
LIKIKLTIKILIFLEKIISFDNHLFFNKKHNKMTKIPKNYKPTQKEKFMNAKMKEYFRLKLVNWKNELLKESSQTIANLQKEENTAKPDITDRASEEIERSFELRTRDRERKLINKIDAAIKRIENKNYGYCEETGEPIGIKRLEARPVATLSIEAQEMHEIKEKKIN